VVELADIFRDAGPAYLQRFGDRMLPSHKRVMRHIIDCRTPALGGLLYLCSKCDAEHGVCRSCGDRHCPKCQGYESERWLEKQRQLLLPCEYGFACCTVPAGLREVTRSHQRTVYPILLRAAARAVLEVSGRRRFVGGLTGVMTVLHTWTQVEIYHPHVHLVFPIGGLSKDGDSWIKPRSRTYVVPKNGIAKVFRETVEREFRKVGLYDQVPSRVWRQRWGADVKRVGGGEKVLLYLSRYVFRVAISNERIVAYDGARVSFRFKDQKGNTQLETLAVDEFIRRFLLHVLPKGFVKVRYYGLWASACRPKLLAARRILEAHHKAIGKKPRRCVTSEPAPRWAPRCPRCGTPYTSPPTRIPRSRGPP